MVVCSIFFWSFLISIETLTHYHLKSILRYGVSANEDKTKYLTSCCLSNQKPFPIVLYFKVSYTYLGFPKPKSFLDLKSFRCAEYKLRSVHFVAPSLWSLNRLVLSSRKFLRCVCRKRILSIFLSIHFQWVKHIINNLSWLVRQAFKSPIVLLKQSRFLSEYIAHHTWNLLAPHCR